MPIGLAEKALAMEWFDQLIGMVGREGLLSGNRGLVVASGDWPAVEEHRKNLVKHLTSLHPGLSVEVSLDDLAENLILLLDEMTWEMVHFVALGVRDYLKPTGALVGPIGVGMIPEDSAEAQAMLEAMSQAILRGKQGGKAGEVKLFFGKYPLDQTYSLLLIDGDRTLREFLQVHFTARGYEVYEADDEGEGVNKFQDNRPDVVITELTLPTGDGFSLINQLVRANSEQGQGKIVVLTHRRSEEDICQAFDLGVADYLTKPFSPVELAARIKRLLPGSFALSAK